MSQEWIYLSYLLQFELLFSIRHIVQVWRQQKSGKSVNRIATNLWSEKKKKDKNGNFSVIFFIGQIMERIHFQKCQRAVTEFQLAACNYHYGGTLCAFRTSANGYNWGCCVHLCSGLHSDEHNSNEWTADILRLGETTEGLFHTLMELILGGPQWPSPIIVSFGVQGGG